MRIQILFVGMSFALVVPASAQPPVAPEAAQAQAQVEAQMDAELRSQVTAFKYVLQEAVERGGQRLAEWAGQIVPGVELVFGSYPVVDAIPLPESGVVFEVRVPEIMQTSMMLFARRQRPSPNQPVAVPPAGGRVGATGVVSPDPMAMPDARTADGLYSDFVREALLDAIIDGSRILAIERGHWLTVAASGVEETVPNPLYRSTSRKLILSIKGEDLQALRAGTITRDEARTRIVERRF